ncbi:MAG: hypothetical protein JWQ95_170 [Sphaerisporangium sp.]|jgi:hypothetical protein|nr:hypothetical protein [Sphaerisporangium sp.]
MKSQGEARAGARVDRPASPGQFACPGCGAVSRLEPIGRTLAGGTGTGSASWEMWLRGRGEEVTAMVRVGRRVTERNGTGEVDVVAMLADAWHAAAG